MRHWGARRGYPRERLTSRRWSLRSSIAPSGATYSPRMEYWKRYSSGGMPAVPTMRITCHPEKRLMSESWSSLSRRILGDNIGSTQERKYAISGCGKKQYRQIQTNRNQAGNSHPGIMPTKHYREIPVDEPCQGHRNQYCHQRVVLQCLANVKMQQMIERPGASASRTLPAGKGVKQAN